MENPTSFDLNLTIEQWRVNLAQSAAFTTANLDELESHLRDSTAMLQSRGLSAEEAFLIAARRTGESELLTTEFAKLNVQAVWLDRFLWMLIGVQVWSVVSGIFNSISKGVLVFGWIGSTGDLATGVHALPVALFATVQLLAMAASFVFCWWLMVRKGQTVSDWLGRITQMRGMMIAAAVMAVALIFVVHLANYFVQFLALRVSVPQKVAEMTVCMYYSGVIALVLQVVAFVAITFHLGRKRAARKENSLSSYR
jgi:hypothetical protein